jgi:hypothetical protein
LTWEAYLSVYMPIETQLDLLNDPAIVEQERRELERLEQERLKEMLVDSDDDDSLYSLPKVIGQSQAPGAAEAGTVSSASAISGAVAPASDATSGAVAPASSDLVSHALNASATVLSDKESAVVGIHKTITEKGMGNGFCIGSDEGKAEKAAGSATIQEDDFKDDTSSAN